MQYLKIRNPKTLFLLPFFLLGTALCSYAQVSSVEYGKNRVQYKTFKWQYYQSLNFNCYFYDNGQELAKYVAQIAEEELPSIERFIEYSLQRRANIVIYNTFNDMRQSNIGLGIGWQSAGGTTQLVNNKVMIYFNGNHADLRRAIRQGIAKILVQNLLFGDDLGEMAGNRALLDLPDWLMNGYIAYAAQNWSPLLDDELKSEILSYNYKNFNQFAFEKPLLAGHAFWYFIEEKYGRENTTYLMYLARIYKSLKRATQQVTKKKKFRHLLEEFMVFEMDKYEEDIRRRKYYTKGSEITAVTIGKRLDYFHFNVNPNERDYSFAVVQFKKGQYKLILNDGYENKVLLKYGARNPLTETNPNYPMMAWDPKGTRLAVLYEQESRLKLFVYDVITRVKPYKRDLTGLFDQITFMKYIYNQNHLLLSAVKDGHSDIFLYDIENETVKQITDDVFDDMDPSFVAFPGKNGILFSSNRPNATAKGSDTSLMRNNFNIFFITVNEKGEPDMSQVTQLTDLNFGDARYPTPYNDNHFTFISDQNGIMNRYAGFFTTQSAGVDTLVVIEDELLRNPTARQVDSLLRAYNKNDVDSIAVVALSEDSAYVFPLTNYASGIRETREAGANHQVSEVTRMSDEKILYKLRIDEATLKRRNVTARSTTYMKHLMRERRLSRGERVGEIKEISPEEDIFQHEFEPEEEDEEVREHPVPSTSNVLSRANLYDYKPRKFAADYVMAGFNNDVLATRYQPYTGSGPINLTSNNGINGMIRVGVADLMEDLKISGGFRLSTNLKDNDWLLSLSNLRKRVDWGLLYYRSTLSATTAGGYPARMISNLYQASISYPFDVVRSVRVHAGVRRDKITIGSVDIPSSKAPDNATNYGVLRAEYVYDNTLNPTMNIWNGARYKAYIDWHAQLTNLDTLEGRHTFNFGFDARYYQPIYRNFIWAGRVAGDFSWGNQKFIYYLGGIDNWIMLANNVKDVDGKRTYRYFNPANRPDPDQNYAYQTLAVNMRGFIQNAANGNNAVVINSEFRLPVFTTLLRRPINNAFLRNFQIIQFVDLGTAWNGRYDEWSRPSQVYSNFDQSVQVKIKAPGIGPFLGGYGFGARSTLLGYFLKFDVGWPMSGFFSGKPIMYFSMGLDF